MSRFIQRLIARQATGAPQVTPRVRGRFEPGSIVSQGWVEPGSSATDDRRAVVPASVPSSPAPVVIAAPAGQDNGGSESVSSKDRSGERLQTPETGIVRQQTARTGDQDKQPVSAFLGMTGRQRPLLVEESSQKIRSAVPEQTASDAQNAVRNAVAEREASMHEQGSGALKERTVEDRSAEQRNPIIVQPRAAEPVMEKKDVPTVSVQPAVSPVIQSVKKIEAPAALPHAEAAPVITVSIGRIEVHAIHPPPVQPERPAAAAKPRLTLEDFLKKRNEFS